jgi:hypothetical protein
MPTTNAPVTLPYPTTTPAMPSRVSRCTSMGGVGTVLLAFSAVACTTESSPQVLPRVMQPGDALAITWSPGENRAFEGQTVQDTIDCGHEVSHPCPYALFTTKLSVTGQPGDAQVVFGSATGGSDANDVPVENHVPWTDDFALDGDVLVLPARGDDAGLRHDARIAPFQGGYAGDVEWTLFNVPGYTTFHVELTFEN